MIVPDVNLLIHAYDSASLYHAKAKTWWEELLSGDEPVGLPQVVVFGFVRLTTNARIVEQPMAAAQAAACVRSWLRQPPAQILVPNVEHVEEVLSLLQRIGTAGNLVTDAQIAAAALDQGAILHTADTDFARFPGLRWYNLITGARATNPS